MAKRRKEKDEEEDKPFKFPKFDEEKFLKRERRNIKTTFLAFLLGIFVALLSFGFYVLLTGNDVRWILVFIFGIFTGSWLKYFFVRLNIDLTDYTNKNWFSSYAIYFFTWLVVLIVLVNPPFYDEEEPLVDIIVLPDMQEPGGTVMILAKITDNSIIEKENIEFAVDGNKTTDFDYIDNIFKYSYTGPTVLSGDETHTYTLTVKDKGGKTTERTGTFTFSNNVINLTTPGSGDYVRAADGIKFRVKTNVWRVYYTVNSGKEINATQDQDDSNRYITYPEYSGWPSGGKNVTVNVSAELIYNFENHIIDGKSYWFVNYINDTSTYVFDVADDPDEVGKKESREIAHPGGKIVGAPGFEMLIMIISLLAVALIFKYRKKHRRN